ncbi:hypothetical protein [Nocardia asteroides]|uniref:hypothetical protein n=1 Tax=Nocardia asteroides TaxID=1824 RepID=UPI0033E2FDD2
MNFERRRDEKETTIRGPMPLKKGARTPVGNEQALAVASRVLATAAVPTRTPLRLPSRYAEPLIVRRSQSLIP